METDMRPADFALGQDLTVHIFLLYGNQSCDGTKIKYSTCVHLAADRPFQDNAEIRTKLLLRVFKTFFHLYPKEFKEKVKHGSVNSFFQLFYKTIKIVRNKSSHDISLLKNLMKEIIQ